MGLATADLIACMLTTNIIISKDPTPATVKVVQGSYSTGAIIKTMMNIHY